MGRAKKIEENSVEISAFAKALGHPARITILSTIAEKGGIIKGETIEVPNLAPATVIQHLRELKKAGILKGRVYGARSNFQLNWTFLNENLVTFENFSDFLKENLSDSAST